MPFGSWKNNLGVMIVVGFVAVSLVSTIAGQVMWNTRNIKVSIAQQILIIDQNKQLIEQHHEMLIILRAVEHRFLVGQTK